MTKQRRWITLLALVVMTGSTLVSTGSASIAGFSVSSKIGNVALSSGISISGAQAWIASPSGATVSKVQFSIDGNVKWTEFTAPYQFQGDPNGLLDTKVLANGQHTLTVRAVATDGRSASVSAKVNVVSLANPAPFSVSSKIGNANLADGIALSGSVAWTGSPSAPASKVAFLIDGTNLWTEFTAPYQFQGDPNGMLDTKVLANGQHTLTVTATGTDGRTSTTQGKVTISNQSTAQFTVGSSIADGASLSGSVIWTGSGDGTTVKKLEFYVDGVLRWTEMTAPYQYNGDPNGLLDTRTLSDGAHTFKVIGYAVDGRTASVSRSATVTNTSAPTPFSIVSSIADGATLKDSVIWTATAPANVTSKVQFLIDGTLKWTDSYPTYQFNGDPNGVLDTSTLSNGAHVLQVIAYATDGRTASVSSSVSVSNTTSQPGPSLGSIPRFGIATGYKILNRSAADQAFELDQIKAIGGKLVRFDSLPGNQSQVNPVVDGVLARGMEPILVLFGTTRPVSPSTAASFAASQAAKWKGRVRLYEFANEPDLNGWNGTNYAQALIPVYNAIKANDPNAIVIAGALWTSAGGPVKWVTDMYNAGAKGHFDILSLHLYDDPFAAGSWNIWNMAFRMTPSVRSVMDAHGDQAIPIGATEAGGPVYKYGESGQASIVGHDFDALAQDPRLAFICVYAMMDDEVSGFGLLDPNRVKRPAWNVYASRAT